MYKTREVEVLLSLTKHTLRYYEKTGLLPDIRRDQSGNRVYSKDDVAWIYMIRCLRDIDMPIREIKAYIDLLKQGGGTISKRKELILQYQQSVAQKIVKLQKGLVLMDKKLQFYEDMLIKPEEEVSCYSYQEEWNNFKKLLGEITYE